MPEIVRDIVMKGAELVIRIQGCECHRLHPVRARHPTHPLLLPPTPAATHLRHPPRADMYPAKSQQIEVAKVRGE